MKEAFKSEFGSADKIAGNCFMRTTPFELLRFFCKNFIRNIFLKNRGLYAGICLCLLSPLPSETTVHNILHASTPQKLQTHLKKHKALTFEKTLCEKQLKINAIPSACYPFSELKRRADLHCLELEIKDVTLLSLKKALFFQLSTSCRKHLKSFEKILLYRKKDALLLKKP